MSAVLFDYDINNFLIILIEPILMVFLLETQLLHTRITQLLGE